MLDVDIQEMANYCLNCKNKPCSNQGCPMDTPIPDFIDCIRNEKIDYAYKMLTDNNIFSHICSIVCPQEKQCESKCVRGIKGNPVSIGKLEEFVNQTAKEDHLVILRDKKENNGKKDPDGSGADDSQHGDPGFRRVCGNGRKRRTYARQCAGTDAA